MCKVAHSGKIFANYIFLQKKVCEVCLFANYFSPKCAIWHILFFFFPKCATLQSANFLNSVTSENEECFLKSVLFSHGELSVFHEASDIKLETFSMQMKSNFFANVFRIAYEDFFNVLAAKKIQGTN